MGFGVPLIVLSSLGLVLTVPLFVWHGMSRNIPALSLIVWLFLMNLEILVSASIWSWGNFMTVFDGYGWCDVMIKLHTGAVPGILSCVSAICFNLWVVLSGSEFTSRWMSMSTKKKIAIDLASCWTLPVVLIGLSYIVQVFRFFVLKYSGCVAVVAQSYVTILIYSVWLVIASLFASVFAGLTLYQFFMRRKDASDLMKCSNSGLTLRRFCRLLVFCIMVILIMLPVSIYTFVVDVRYALPHFSWSEIHDPDLWIGLVIPDDSVKPIYDRWIYPLLTFATFLIFGLGTEAVSMYKRVLVFLGIHGLYRKVVRKNLEEEYKEQFSDQERTEIASSHFTKYEDIGKSNLICGSPHFEDDEKSLGSINMNYILRSPDDKV
ncbi:hypothetical protein LJB42_003885 [Komagataella kurtzmanii]|nr:hypothetical protein LJB42_003885 [Komagataella kurtzmanii]